MSIVVNMAANECVQLKPRQPRQLEWVQEFGNFYSVSTVASNSTGLLAVSDSDISIHKKVTIFHIEKSQFKKQQKLKS